MASKIFSALIITASFTLAPIGCGGSRVGEGSSETNFQHCRVDSECSAGERCDAQRCVPKGSTLDRSASSVTARADAGTDPRTGVDTAACSSLAHEPQPLDIYLMVDRSTSMAEPLAGTPSAGPKWEAVVAAIQSFVQAPEATGVGVGIQYFGMPDNTCAPGAYATPDVPIQPVPDVAGDIIDSTNRTGPTALTPTYPALQGALEHMSEWALSHPERASVVVLATDGFPTECGEATPDCPECSLSVAALENLARQFADADPPVRTFVVGMDGVQNLNRIAQGGKTTSAFLIDAGNVEEQFRNALIQIATTPLACL